MPGSNALPKYRARFTSNALSPRDIFRYLRWLPSLMSGRSLFAKALANQLHTHTDQVHLFSAGRMALYECLRTISLLTPKRTVVVAGFTCTVVPNAAKYANFNVKYVDINPETLNLDTELLLKQDFSDIAAIIITHNFGIHYKDISKIRSAHPDVFLIEDAAHCGDFSSFATDLKDRGDALFFSFEFSKPFSTGMGGALITYNKAILSLVQSNYPQIASAPFKNSFRIFMSLLVHILTCGPSSSIFRHRAVILLNFFGLKYETPAEELQGRRPIHYPSKMANPLAIWGVIQIENISAILYKKKLILELYKRFFSHSSSYSVLALDKNDIPVRFPILLPTENRAKVKQVVFDGIRLEVGEWFNDPVHPKGSFRFCYPEDFEPCPYGLSTSKKIINFPININYVPKEEQLEALLKILEINAGQPE